ncbi:MAG: peptidase domain-containing ABC transporter [Cyclobacteriaceae bacterium]|nr:peptidase domain-containing ABC transporter [Cyclobacteriaceae bacterium]
MDCGPACLKMVFKHYGKQLNLEGIKRAAQIGSTGVSLLGMAEAAEKYGFRTVSARVSFEQLLEDAPLPCILHWNQYHFVVLTPAANTKKLTIADPAKGLITLSKADFLQNWISVTKAGEPKGIVLLLTPRANFYQQEDDRNEAIGWGLLARYATQYRKQIFQLFMGLLLGSLLQLVFPYLTQSIVDTGINTQNLHFIQIILIAQFALFFGQTAVEFIRSRILLFVSTHINLSILSDFWIKLMRLPLSFFDTKQTGDIIQRIGDHHRIESFITGTALQILFSVFNLLIFSVVLLTYNTTVFTIFFAGSIIYLVWIRIFLSYRRTLDYKRFGIASKESSATMQLVFGMHEIKLNNAERLKRWEWESLQAGLFKLNFKSLSLNQYQQAGAFFINQGKNILITYLVAKSVLDGQLTLGAMLAIQYIIGQLNSPVEQLIAFSQQAQDAKISLERLNEIHQLEDEESTDQPFVNIISENQEIQLKGVSFTYAGAGNTPVISNLNMVFPGGKVTALVGMSGSGKTTILKLIQRFYENYKGEIKIGERNLKYLSPQFWRSISGSVMQEGYIFSDSIERNIAVGDQVADYQKLIHACKVANILSFIESLPLGFNTKIGAEGNGISSGQKQRILIARAVYKNPKFLLFDEATNALDANNETAIMENLQEFFKGRTVIIVAHRLSTVKNADKIVVLESGTVLEEGNHKDLVERRGKYYELVKNQLELGD